MCLCLWVCMCIHFCVCVLSHLLQQLQHIVTFRAFQELISHEVSLSHSSFHAAGDRLYVSVFVCVYVCVCICVMSVCAYVCVYVCTLWTVCVADTLHLTLIQLTDGGPYGVSQYLHHASITMCDLCFFNRQTAPPTHTYTKWTCSSH